MCFLGQQIDTLCFFFFPLQKTGGVGWPVPAGRLDGRFSSAAAAAANIPDPSFNVQQLTENFGRKGFSREEMIILSGFKFISSHLQLWTLKP